MVFLRQNKDKSTWQGSSLLHLQYTNKYPRWTGQSYRTQAFGFYYGFFFKFHVFQIWSSSPPWIRSTHVAKKNPAYGRQSISWLMRIEAPIPQYGGQKIPQNPNLLKSGKNLIKRNISKMFRNMPKLAISPLSRGL